VRNVTVMRQATNDDDFYVTDTPATQDCAGGAPACARVSDFQIDGGSRNMMPASTIGQTFTSIVGVVDGVKNTQSLTPRTTGDMITP